jgi:hypothetical protein
MKTKLKKLALVGFSATNRDLAPYDNPEYEIWSLNHAWGMEFLKRCDVYFDLHPKSWITLSVGRSEPERQHYEWLQQPHDFKIYMQEKFPEFPASVRYPIEAIRKKYADFHTSSLSYMIALALHQGYKWIEIYGFDMAADSEYNYQRDSAEYFIGLAMGLGVHVYVPENCPLCKGRIYAFNDSSIGLRQKIEFRKRRLEMDLDGALGRYHHIQGYLDQMEKLMAKYPDLRPLHQKMSKEEIDQMNLCHMTNGAVQECDEMFKIYSDFYSDIGAVKFGNKPEATVTSDGFVVETGLESAEAGDNG